MKAGGGSAETEGLDPAALSTALTSISSLLGLGAQERDALFLARLQSIAEGYAGSHAIEPLYGNPAEQKRLFRQLASSLEKSLYLLRQLSPEYLVTIDAMAEREAPESGSGPSPSDALARLADAAELFAANYAPKRGAATNLPLEEAVRELIPLIEDYTGSRVEVSMNKAKGFSPTLSSPEAKALGVLLRVVDARLSDTTIANMIDKVRRQPRETAHHLEAIWDADPHVAVDASLLPRRHERE